MTDDWRTSGEEPGHGRLGGGSAETGLEVDPLVDRDPRPLYVRTAEALTGLIEREGLSGGDRLPSEADLAQRLRVSRGTVREALRELELRGRIRRVHGRGTTVVDPAPILTGLTALESLESLADRQGWRCGTTAVEMREIELGADLAAVQEVPPGHPGIYLTRVKTRDGRPIARMETWMAATLVPIQVVRERFESSITDLLRAGIGSLRLDYAIAQVSACAADGEEASALHVGPGSPLVVLSEVFYQNPARVLCSSRNLFVPDSILLEVMRVPST